MGSTNIAVRTHDARALKVALTSAVEASQIALVDGILGLTVGSGVSGDNCVLEIMPRIIEMSVPTALYGNLAVGDKLYIDAAQVTGHTPDDAAYTETATGNVYFGFVVEKIDDTAETIAVVFSPEGN